MDSFAPSKQELEQFCRHLPILEPFLNSPQKLQDEAEQLARFISRFLPVCQLLLVRLTGQGLLKDVATWADPAKNIEDLCHQFAKKHLPDIIQMVANGQIMEDGQLEAIASSMVGGAPLPCHPTMTPIYFSGALVGLTILGKPAELGFWNQGEKELITSLLRILGVSFANKNYNDDYALQSWVFNAVMDNMSVNLYVTDVTTDQILFMNKSMKKAFGLQHPEGQICWKLLQKGMTRRCDFCPVHVLNERAKKQPGPVSHIWEEHNTVTGRTYENYDSLMHWTDGSLVHFQQSVDITDSKTLTKAANTDELTDMLNRRGGKQALGETLKTAKANRQTVTLCMYDVNGLKEVNDAFGHGEGDRLLQTISAAVKNEIGANAYPFRLSGDEFIVVFRDTSKKEAHAIMQEVLHLLAKQPQGHTSCYDTGFCFGLLEIPPEENRPLPELLTMVDEKMYEQKRRFHIKKAEQALLLSKKTPLKAEAAFTYDTSRLYDALVKSTDDYIFICNMKTNVFRYSKAMVEEFGLPGEVIENAAAVWGAKVHELDKQVFLDSNQEIADGRADSHNVEYRAKNRNGDWIWVRCRGHVERDETGEPVLFAGMITNLGKKNKVDHVTGLFNKFVFEEDLQSLLNSGESNPIGIMTLGMDDFKHINDLYSREFGDEVIRISSQKIQGLLPEDAVIYRLDGDEFGVIAKGASKADMEALYNRMRAVFSHQQEVDGKKYYCSLSAGCTLYPQDGSVYSKLRKYAGYSLEYAKSNGKNHLIFYSPELLLSKTTELELTECLRESVEQGFKGFRLHYQVQVDAKTGVAKGAEALARWSCEKYGNVPPDKFIPLLEESGLILPVGRWIFKTACAACAGWVKKDPHFTMSINLSYLQLKDGDFIEFMKSAMEETEISPSHIIAELTESYLASNISSLTRAFEEIRKLGIRIAMDDFGTGYSSLGILKSVPADIVKVDRAFLKDIRKSSFDSTFIRFIVELCHDVGIKVCLEGVETEEEYHIVRRMQPDFIQGFLFGRPEPGDVFEDTWLRIDEKRKFE